MCIYLQSYYKLMETTKTTHTVYISGTCATKRCPLQCYISNCMQKSVFLSFSIIFPPLPCWVLAHSPHVVCHIKKFCFWENSYYSENAKKSSFLNLSHKLSENRISKIVFVNNSTQLNLHHRI